MKFFNYFPILILLGILFHADFTVSAQTVIWSEDFDGNSGAGSNWGTLNQDIGAQGATPNQWYISCTENGNAVGVCGSGCGANNTLHLGSTTAGDLGAAYDAGCDLSCFFCSGFGFCSFTNTDRRSQSTNISTVGSTGLTLNFDYIENGSGAVDNCFVEYSVNGGTSWVTLSDPAKTALCAGGQGLWTAYSIALPAACENIANLRIAFRWQNDADANGTDPSFAVNDITITKAIILPIQLLSFKAYNVDDYIKLEWETLSELNNAYYTVERSNNGINWEEVSQINGAGNSSRALSYFYNDYAFYTPITYYRLKQTDFDGESTYSSIISIQKEKNNELILYPNPVNNNLTLSLNAKSDYISLVVVTNHLGQKVLKQYPNQSNIVIDLSTLKKGIYFVKIVDSNGNSYVRKIVKN